ncbi:hopanoid biosynthesis-associated protein HpnK [Methylosinus sp. KRF6]|uniref:hopanoid biosynthesis-associated protein HpnK n=1 Tax=Methylosinus sp. KRF6 TaxID=2846853 RepID=UPI0035304DAE
MCRRRGTLIITADDFGLATEVNEAVERAHCSGILTAASLMVGASAAGDAVARAHKLKTLRVGLHVTLVDGAPTSPLSNIPDLLDGEQFRRDLARLGVEIACRPSVRHQLRAEITAQFEAFVATGLPLDHVNAHAHYHIHPIVAAEIISIGRRYGLRAMRVPREPIGMLASIEAGVKPQPRTVDFFVGLLASRARNATLLAPTSVFGWAWSGAMTKKRLLGLLQGAPDGITEIYTHPAVVDHFVGHASGYGYRQEFDALCAPETIEAARSSRLLLGGYGDA